MVSNITEIKERDCFHPPLEKPAHLIYWGHCLR